MSRALPKFRLLRPESVEQALDALRATPGARLCAGGTDLIVNMRRGLVAAETLVDLSGIGDLKTIGMDESGLRIGAGVTLRDLADHAGIALSYRAISQASRAVAGPSHREAATIGGNLCQDTRCLYYNQSHWWRKSTDFCLKYRGDICHVAPRGKRCRAAFCGDLAPALMVYGAQVDIAGPKGIRRIALTDLYREDGTDYLTLGRDEIVIAVIVPPTDAASVYDKIRVRGAIDFPLAGVAVACLTTPDGAKQISIAVTGTNSRPVGIDVPPLQDREDPKAYFAALGKRMQKGVSPQRTTTIAPHYRRLSVAALAMRLARSLI
ncbi:MAG: 4-hydroxybenzoyl-CoA reductase subunit beta [Rhodobacteraceae bacterium]|nr:4-hydroxybenzoyl-CoA reductase subunit beta [Paracoccaceae bacterium]